MIHVVDDFFSDVFSVRRESLSVKYSIDSDGMYPGYRSDDVSSFVKSLVSKQVKKLTGDETLNCRYISYQYIPSKYKEGCFHQDDVKYTCIIYLNDGVNSGTEICETIPKMEFSLYKKHVSLKEDFYKNPNDLIKSFKCHRMIKKVNSYFSPTYTVASKMNRMLLFKGNLYHRAQNFFGDSVENSRLTLVSFFA